MLLQSSDFRREREANWRALEALVARIESRGPSALSAEELTQLPILYRGVVSSLSVARATSLDKNTLHYLENLAARAYLCVYNRPRRLLPALWRYLVALLPSLLAQLRRPLLVAVGALLLGWIVGYALTLHEPERFYSFVPEALAGERGPSSTREELLSVLRGSGDVDDLSAFAGFLFGHNAKIGLTCFVLGLFLGVPVLYLLFTNGLTMGAFVAIHAQHDLSLEMWAWLLPHGITELLAVCLAGAIGLSLGGALLWPGTRTRLDALAEHGRDGAAAMLLAVLMFLLAALLEGFFRQLVHSDALRLSLALATAIFWGWFFAREPRPRTA